MNKSGIILIILGCLFLAGNFGLLRWSWLQEWWPLILIAVGIWSLFSHRGGAPRARQDQENEP
jgi:hypothetical protein